MNCDGETPIVEGVCSHTFKKWRGCRKTCILKTYFTLIIMHRHKLGGSLCNKSLSADIDMKTFLVMLVRTLFSLLFPYYCTGVALCFKNRKQWSCLHQLKGSNPLFCIKTMFTFRMYNCFSHTSTVTRKHLYKCFFSGIYLKWFNNLKKKLVHDFFSEGSGNTASFTIQKIFWIQKTFDWLIDSVLTSHNSKCSMYVVILGESRWSFYYIIYIIYFII